MTQWVTVPEIKPSLNKHFMRSGEGHLLSHDCWCHPTLRGEPVNSPPFTVVLHNENGFSEPNEET